MPLITIKTRDGEGHMLADVFDLWGIHSAPGYTFAQQRYQVTHLPTGYAFLGTYGASYERCMELIQEINASGLDWSFTSPSKMPTDNKPFGSTLRAKYTDEDPSLSEESTEV